MENTEIFHKFDGFAPPTFHNMLYYVVSCFAAVCSGYIKFYCITVCCAMPCDVMLGYVTLCYVIFNVSDCVILKSNYVTA